MYNLIQFIKKFNFYLFFLVLEGISLYLLSIHNHYQSNKIQGIVQSGVGYIHNNMNNITNWINLKEENRYLAEENAKLLSLLKQQQKEIDPLQLNDSIFKFTSASIINNSVHLSNNYLTIDKGSKHGIKTGMGVLGPNGLVGIVYSVSERFSLVISILHQKSSISVRLKKESYLGRMLWKGFDYRKMEIEDIPNHAFIQIGDTVVSSGNSAIFPQGINIGKITGFHKIPGENFYSIQIQLFEDLNRLTYVYVAESLQKEEREQLEKNILND